jgi:hypothetical protein
VLVGLEERGIREEETLGSVNGNLVYVDEGNRTHKCHCGTLPRLEGISTEDTTEKAPSQQSPIVKRSMKETEMSLS